MRIVPALLEPCTRRQANALMLTRCLVQLLGGSHRAAHGSTGIELRTATWLSMLRVCRWYTRQLPPAGAAVACRHCSSRTFPPRPCIPAAGSTCAASLVPSPYVAALPAHRGHPHSSRNHNQPCFFFCAAQRGGGPARRHCVAAPQQAVRPRGGTRRGGWGGKRARHEGRKSGVREGETWGRDGGREGGLCAVRASQAGDQARNSSATAGPGAKVRRATAGWAAGWGGVGGCGLPRPAPCRRTRDGRAPPAQARANKTYEPQGPEAKQRVRGPT